MIKVLTKALEEKKGSFYSSAGFLKKNFMYVFDILGIVYCYAVSPFIYVTLKGINNMYF